MDFSGSGDYDVNTPFKYEGDDQDEAPQSGVGDDSRPGDPSQDDLIYPPLDFPTSAPNDAAPSNSDSHMMDSQPSDQVTSNSNGSNHLGDSNTNQSVAMDTSQVEGPLSSPESEEEIPLAARTRRRPSRSTRTKKSFAEVNDEEEEEDMFDTKPPKGINLYEASNTVPLLGTQSIFCLDIQKERRANLTKGSKKKKKKEPEFCRFCFTNELSLTKIRSAKLPPSSTHPNTKLTTLVPSVSEIDLCLTEKWTNPSFQLVCDDCVLVFSQFYEFRQSVQTNDTLLRRLYCSSKAKSKKAPITPTSTTSPASALPATPKPRGRPPKIRDPSSDDSDAKSTVSTKSNKKRARGKRKGVTDDEDTDGYLSSVSRASKKSTSSKKGGKKKKGGATSDEETDGYMSSVSRKSNNTGSASKSKKKRRYNSDSDNEDVKSDASDGLDYVPAAYEDFNIKQESECIDLPQDALDYQAQQTTRVLKDALKQRKLEKRARKGAKWNFKRSTEVKDAATIAQEEIDMLNRRIKQELDSDEDNVTCVDSSWDDSSGISSSDWSSVGELDEGEETDGYLTSASTRSTGKKRKRKYRKRKMASGNQTGCESETGGETDADKVVKQEDTIDELPTSLMSDNLQGLPASEILPVSAEAQTENKRKRKPLSQKQMARRRMYCKKRMRLTKYFKKENYPCKYCSIVLHSYESYLKHLKSNHHGYEISTLCFICGFSSSKRSTLAHHIQDHIQPRKKQKQICEICCAEVYHINGHIKDKHSGFFLQCPHCPKRFPRKTELNNHIKGIHMKHELRQAFVCEYCNKEFTFFQYLKRHMRTHTNEKPYKCVCGLGFNFNVSLKNHKQKCSVYLQLSLQQQQQQLGNR